MWLARVNKLSARKGIRWMRVCHGVTAVFDDPNLVSCAGLAPVLRLAGRAGLLVTRPLEQTLTDTLAWDLARPEPGPHGAGLTDEEECNLLDALASTVR